MDDTLPNTGQTNCLTDPVGDNLLDFGQGRCSLPGQSDHAKAGAQEVTEHTFQGGVPRDVPKEPWMLPMHQVRGDKLVKIVKHSIKRLAKLGW